MRIDEWVNFFNNKVGICKITDSDYPFEAPFYPPEIYPEYPFKGDPIDKNNHVYPAIRELFYMLSMDLSNFGSSCWNPFREIVHPGDNVLIKPNISYDNVKSIEATITHGSIIRVITDYVIIALQGKGQIIIADSSTEWANFHYLCELNGLKNLQKYYENKGLIKIKIVDLREFIVDIKLLYRSRHRIRNASLSKEIDLGNLSMLSNQGHNFFSNGRYYLWKTKEYHNKSHHVYKVPIEILQANVIIMIPKMKTHGKAGTTLSLKNTVGILSDKRCLLHERLGFPPFGDEYPRPPMLVERKVCLLHSRLRRPLIKFGRIGGTCYALMSAPLKRIISERYLNDGRWYGNDTLWRGVIDINKILLYSDIYGDISSKIQRKYFSVIDGIIAGEKNGPFNAIPKECGVIVAGFNPVATDVICTNLMGFHYDRIPLIRNALKDTKLFKSNNEIKIVSNYEPWTKFPISKEKSLEFEAADGWKSII